MQFRSFRAGAATLIAATGLVLVACSDPTASTTSGPNLGPNLAVGDPSPSTAVAGEIRICKLGNVPGNFTVSPGSPITVNTGECKTAAVDNTTPGSTITITETSPGLQSVTIVRSDGAPDTFSNGGTLFLNQYHGYTLTFTNQVAEHRGCTFTQGYYKNHENVVVALLAAGGAYIVAGKLTVSANGTVGPYTAAQVDAIYETPPKGGNAQLILLHQLMTAELNVAGGASAPAAVLTAISDARTLMNGGISAAEAAQAKSLASTLDAYNNGITGPGHCDDRERIER